MGSASPWQRKVVSQRKSRVLLLWLPTPGHPQGSSQTDLTAVLASLPVRLHGLANLVAASRCVLPPSLLHSALSQVPAKRSGQKPIKIDLRSPYSGNHLIIRLELRVCCTGMHKLTQHRNILSKKDLLPEQRKLQRLQLFLPSPPLP